MFEFADSYVMASDAYRDTIDNWLDGIEDILEVADANGRDAIMVWEEELMAADELDHYLAGVVEY
jgi:hypothetical protein